MRIRFLLGMWCGLALVAGLTVVADDRLDLGGDAGDQVVGSPGGPAGGGAPPDGGGDDPVIDPDARDGDDAPGPQERLAPEQARIEGTVTELVIGDAVLDPPELAVPLTIESGGGSANGARIAGGTVEGRAATVEWDAGRPLVLATGVALVTGEVRLELVAGRLLVRLGGAGHALRPGRYRIESPVAIGHQGLATPRDAVDLDADDTTVLEARGDAHVVVDGGAGLTALGPGSLLVVGDLWVTTASGTTTASRVELPTGSFEVTLSDAGGGAWRLSALIEGDAVVT